jgi:hypothetical protein
MIAYFDFDQATCPQPDLDPRESGMEWRFYGDGASALIYIERELEGPNGREFRWSFTVRDRAGKRVLEIPEGNAITKALRRQLPDLLKRESGVEWFIPGMLSGWVRGLPERVAQKLRGILRRAAERGAHQLGLSDANSEGEPL